jgi:hypothetical protein
MAKGGPQIVDDVAAFYISQYNLRMRMKSLGFSDSFENLDCLTAEAFSIISQEIDRVQDDDMKKKRK